ncbi:MAG: methionyl-tRNA formyltransferase [Candidatus Moranbacteria bacterium]|nr:methionyl-tRNA formyltransferase [Candidatus Moranbacteria bacterium]
MPWQSKRLIFAGGSDWAVEFLETLINEGFNITGVLAPPNSQRDRGQKAIAPVLKTRADKLKIPVWQPPKLNNPVFLEQFKKVKPDLVVVVAYGKIFPPEILAIPSLGFINFHPSLLPKLRGPSPIMSAILEGHMKTGISIMKLGEDVDNGPILFQQTVNIKPRETNQTLTRKLVDLGKEKLPKILRQYIEGKITLKPQPEKGVTFCKMIKKEDGRIDWRCETAEQIDRKVRALNPQFKTFTFLKKNSLRVRVNILETRGIYVETQHATSSEGIENLQPGQYQGFSNNLAVATKKGILLISRLQIEGKNPISAADFLRGYSSIENKFLLV